MAHKVLVYGTLKKGRGNHWRLEKSNLLGLTSIKGKMYSLGAFPGVRLDEEGTVQCEAYEVDDYTLGLLDSLEGYDPTRVDNDFYTREKVEFDLDGGTHEGFIYQIARLYGDEPVVESGVW